MSDTAVAAEEKAEPQNEQSAQGQGTADVQSVEFQELDGTDGSGKGTSIDLLLDLEVPIMVAIGQTEIPIQRLLKLNPGSVLKLDKPIDAPVELYLKDAKFATGEIVVVEDKFAVRIKEIISRQAMNKPGKD